MKPEVLDTTGLKCPLPVLKARKQLKAMEAGQVLEVRATDPDSPKDFEAFCATTGYVLEHSGEESGIFVYRIRKTA